MGELDGDRAADLVFAALRDCPSLSPVLGFKDPESHRFVYPTTPAVLRFVDWSLRKSPDAEIREITRDLLRSRVRARLPRRAATAT